MSTSQTGLQTGLAIAICFLVAALEGYDIQAFGVAAPQLIPQLGLRPAEQGWAASAAMVGLVAAAFAGGWLADRVGRKPVLIGSVLLFGVGSLWTALIQDYQTLLAARLVTGLGFGGALPNLIAMAAELSPPGRRGATTSAMFCGMPVGGTTVALVTKLAGTSLDWRTIFLVGGALPLLVVPLIILFLPETRPERKTAGSTNVLAEILGPQRAFATLLLWAANVLTLIVLYLMLNWLPTLVVAKGHAATDGATASLVFNLCGVVGALLVGFLVDRAGYRWSLLGIYALLAAMMLALAGADQVAALVVSAAAAGFLVHGGLYSLYGLPPRLYPPGVRAAGAGAAVGIGRFGSIVGPVLAGELRGAGWPPGQVFGVMFPVVLIAGAAIVALTYLAPDSAE